MASKKRQQARAQPRRAEYAACAATCAAIDYSSMSSVRKSNAASDRMREIVKEAYATGPSAIAELIPLLDESPSDESLAFQLLDLGRPAPAIVKKCLAIIQRMAAKTGPEGMGASIWLREWHAKSLTGGTAKRVQRGNAE